MLELAASGKVTVTVIEEMFELESIAEAYKRRDEGSVRLRVVVQT
jgi:D-arabinose 1-dehydrogenase-like Zn-dependent alcohol dehydrogenase